MSDLSPQSAPKRTLIKRSHLSRSALLTFALVYYLQDGTRRHCLEAQGLCLPFRPLARLAQNEELGCTGREARGGRRLGQMIRTHSLRCERWGENRPPDGKGGRRLGSVDKGWCCQDRR